VHLDALLDSKRPKIPYFKHQPKLNLKNKLNQSEIFDVRQVNLTKYLNFSYWLTNLRAEVKDKTQARILLLQVST